MAGDLEPHRDQETIRSFKRTCNAALLLWIAGLANHPPSAARTSTRAIGGLLLAVAAWIFTGHDPTRWSVGLP